MISDQNMAETGAAKKQATGNPMQISEHLADSLWRITEAWNDYARTTLAIPLTRAMDEIGLPHVRHDSRQSQPHITLAENADRPVWKVRWYPAHPVKSLIC